MLAIKSNKEWLSVTTDSHLDLKGISIPRNQHSVISLRLLLDKPPSSCQDEDSQLTLCTLVAYDVPSVFVTGR